MSLVRSISGLRGTLGDSLTPPLIARYVAAFAHVLPDGEIVVGFDGRPSGQWIQPIVAGTLVAMGRTVHMIGMVPSPTVQLCVEAYGAAGGISITASHNNAAWNGLKFIQGDGTFFGAEINQRLWQALDGDTIAYPSAVGGQILYRDDAISNHIASLISSNLHNADELELISNRKLRVVVDAVNASGSVAVPHLLDFYGCDVIPLFCHGTGVFPHEPEPVPTNLGALAEAVGKYHADLGVAVDPDADRLVLIDERGTPVREELTIVLATEAVLSMKDRFPQFSNDVVINLSTTMAVEECAARFGAKVHRSSVGEANVVGLMREVNAVIGGEGSGGVIGPFCHYGRDSLVGLALIVHLIATRRQSLSVLTGSYSPTTMLKKAKPFSGDFALIAERIQAHFQPARIITSDGLWCDMGDAWMHIRTSNTEPIMRMIVEARSESRAHELMSEIEELGV